MSAKHVIVEGATVKCKFSVEPKTDKLKVLSQNLRYANDKSAEKKLIATNKEIGQTLEKNTFGKCKMQPNGSGDFLPCMATITQWSGFYENATIEQNKGKLLLDDSKATCPIGGPDCISVDKHGQKAEASQQQSRKSDDATMEAVNPASDNKTFKEDDEQENQTFAE